MIVEVGTEVGGKESIRPRGPENKKKGEGKKRDKISRQENTRNT